MSLISRLYFKSGLQCIKVRVQVLEFAGHVYKKRTSVFLQIRECECYAELGGEGFKFLFFPAICSS